MGLKRFSGKEAGPILMTCTDQQDLVPASNGEFNYTGADFGNDALLKEIERTHGKYFAWTQQVGQEEPIYPTEFDAGMRNVRQRTETKYTSTSALEKLLQRLK